MRTIFAEYNPGRNSIDVYTSADYMLRIDCWEAEKNLRTTPGSDCALNTLAIDEPLEYARLYLDGNLQMWGRCRRFLDIIVMFKKSSLCNAQELFICRHLFICAVCINYRLNLLHKGIIVVLVINSAEHWFAYNIAISVNKYSCWKGHDF